MWISQSSMRMLIWCLDPSDCTSTTSRIDFLIAIWLFILQMIKINGKMSKKWSKWTKSRATWARIRTSEAGLAVYVTFYFPRKLINKANQMDLIAAACLIILLKLYSNRRFFGPCDLEIWWMTSKNYRAPILYYTKLCASFQIHRWIQTGVIVWKRSIQVKIGEFLPRVTLKFDGWPWKTIRHLFNATLSFVHHFKANSKLQLNLQSGNTQFRSIPVIFCAVWPWNLTDDLKK